MTCAELASSSRHQQSVSPEVLWPSKAIDDHRQLPEIAAAMGRTNHSSVHASVGRIGNLSTNPWSRSVVPMARWSVWTSRTPRGTQRTFAGSPRRPTWFGLIHCLNVFPHIDPFFTGRSVVRRLDAGRISLAEPGEYTDLATRHLVKSVQSQRDGSHLTRLASLRELRDPGMAQFHDLLQHDEWQVQSMHCLGSLKRRGRRAGAVVGPVIQPRAGHSNAWT